ncbi:hypothetical protein PsorP6_017603 [Peronosclerospora sorghi]|uniref:Uncharacterized protein n=1 Tax=Peronosclerospora sorghi TaxID=230839 RepID=A0ACC0WNV5_9STRA|nr:hypothetical protein PsorP6_017603 [Peronosclerospora sorghi]
MQLLSSMHVLFLLIALLAAPPCVAWPPERISETRDAALETISMPQNVTSDVALTTGESSEEVQERGSVISMSRIKAKLMDMYAKVRMWWYQRQGNAAQKVFALLQLNRGKEKLFTSRAFFSMARRCVDSVLNAAKKDKATWSVACQLEDALIETWPRDPHDVFHLLQLETVKLDLFGSPEFGTWLKFVAKIEPDHMNELVLSELLLNDNYRVFMNKALTDDIFKQKLFNKWCDILAQHSKRPE